MKTDPNTHCTKFKERRLWAIVHDLIAHPIMAITQYHPLAIALHNWTSFKAWTRDVRWRIKDFTWYSRTGVPKRVDDLTPEEARNALRFMLRQDQQRNGSYIPKKPEAHDV